MPGAALPARPGRRELPLPRPADRPRGARIRRAPAKIGLTALGIRGRSRRRPGERPGADDGRETLLVNYWCANPIGHAIEGLRYCLGYHRANPELRVSLVLNGTSATELASLCPFVERTYPVAYGFWADDRSPARALRPVPRDWDYVADDARSRHAAHLARIPNLRRYHEASARHFRARRRRGAVGEAPPPYDPHGRLRLELPRSSVEHAGRELGAAVRIALMPAGSGRPSNYPSAASWIRIVRALAAVYPDACFCLVGKLARDGRTSTAITREKLDRIADACPATVDCFDRPLVDQLASVQACHLFLSPHTGFGMAALAVGTPWLTVSGGPWYEYLFNGVPFHSLLPPDRERYPCFYGATTVPVVAQDEDGEGERTPSMTRRRIEHDLPELVDAAGALIERRLSYEDALEGYFGRLLTFLGGNPRRIHSFDGLHARYL